MNWALPFRLSRWLIAAIFGVLIVGTRALAQQPAVRPYDSEEDLWEALREGEITYDNYIDLLETSRVGTDSVLVPVSDWEELPGSDAGYLMAPDTTDGLTRSNVSPVRSSKQLRWNWRSGYNGDLASPTANDGYFTGRFAGSTWSGLANWRHDGTSARWQRRVMAWRGYGVRIQAGNVEPRFGRGLVIGRRSRIISSSMSNRPHGDLVQPAQSRFNGYWLASDNTRALSGDVVVSDIRSDRLIDRMIAANVTGGSKAVRVGIAALSGDVKRRDSSGSYSQQVISGHLRAGHGKREVLAEIAFARGGATAKAVEAVWQFPQGQFHGRAWSYSTGFVNPWGGGPGHSDTRAIHLDAIDEPYLSRTTGERGFSLATRLDPRPAFIGGRAGIRWEWMTHSEVPDEPVQHTWTMRGLWQKGAFALRPFVRGTADEGMSSRYSLGSYADYGPAGRRISGRVEYGQQRTSGNRYVRAGFGAKWRLNQTVRLEPAIRWVDPDLDRPGDGYWYLYFTEVIFPVSALRLEAALVWQRYERRGRGDSIEMRLRMVGGA